MHRVDTIVSDERDTIEERSHVKQALTINDYPEWLINNKLTIQPSLQSATAVASDKTSDDDVRESEIKTSHKKSPVGLPYIPGVLKQLSRMFIQYDIPAYFKPMNPLCQLLVRPKDKILKERVVGPIRLAQWLSRYRRGSIKTMRAQGLWFEARPDRTLSPGSGQQMGSPWT